SLVGITVNQTIVKNYDRNPVKYYRFLFKLVKLYKYLLGSRNALQDYACKDAFTRSEEHTSELQSRFDLVCRLLLEKKNINIEIDGSSPYQSPAGDECSTSFV